MNGKLVGQCSDSLLRYVDGRVCNVGIPLKKMVDQHRRFGPVPGTKLDQIKRTASVNKRAKYRIRLGRKDLELAVCKVILGQRHYLLEQAAALVIIKIFR